MPLEKVPHKEKEAKKVVSKNGACITSDEVTQMLANEREAKLVREAEKKKKQEEKNVADIRKQQDALKRQKTKELNEIKKANKARKECHLCETDLKSDKQNKTKSLNCFRCGLWCCFSCLPTNLKKTAANVYYCNSCVLMNDK